MNVGDQVYTVYGGWESGYGSETWYASGIERHQVISVGGDQVAVWTYHYRWGGQSHVSFYHRDSLYTDHKLAEAAASRLKEEATGAVRGN